MVTARLPGGRIRVRLRNRIRAGEEIEAVSPGVLGLKFPAANLTDAEGRSVDAASVPEAAYDMDAPEILSPGDMLRTRIGG